MAAMVGLLYQWKLTILSTSLWFRHIESLENLALGKQAYQTGAVYNLDASKAVDGVLSQNLGDDSCCHTSGFVDQYWEVDLGRKSTIERVTIYNVKGIHAHRTKDIAIYIGSQQDKYHQVAFHAGQIDLIHTFNLPNSVTGRWIRITRLQSVTEYLHLCEVQVYGTSFEYFRLFRGLVGNGPLLQSENAKTPLLCGYICWKDSNCVAANYQETNNQCNLLSSNSNQTSVVGSMIIALMT